MNKFLPKRLPWKAWAALRVAGIVLALAGGATLLQAELARGAELDRQIRERSGEAETHIEQGARARQFHEVEEPIILEIEKKLQESIPQDQNTFKAFCLKEAEAGTIELTTLRCEKNAAAENSRVGTRDDRPKGAKTATPVASHFVEVPFTIQGRGSYGSVLRFVDRVHTHLGLIAVDKFAIARSSVFSQYLASFRSSGGKAAEEEFPPESHSFVLEGRVFVQGSQAEEER